MGLIKLTKYDQYVLVDDDDYERVSQYKWNLWKKGSVYGWINSSDMPLCKFIYGKKTRKKIFHLNDDKFDFRKSNLSIFMPHVFIDGEYTKVILPSGDIAFTNKQYYDVIKDYTWYKHHTGYAVTTTIKKQIRLHHLILNSKLGMHTDHINHNKLDNRIENLRECTNAQNGYNKPKRQGKWKYKRIEYKRGNWEVSIKKDYITYYIGRFKLEDAAAQAYNIAAKELFKEFAWLNPVEDVESVVTTTGKVINKEYIQQLAQKAL